MVRLFTYSLGDRDSISGRVIPKPQKIVLDTSLLECILTYGSRVSRVIQGKE